METKENVKQQNRFLAFLGKKGVTLSPKLYFVDAMSAMALGLFASLLMGTIFGTVKGYMPDGTYSCCLLAQLPTRPPALEGQRPRPGNTVSPVLHRNTL